ncbi:MAG: hypothetical protein RLY14_2210, partial [Planctomycetota bacterium]
MPADRSPLKRRELFQRVGAALHSAALIHLFSGELLAEGNRDSEMHLHSGVNKAPKATSVIHLFMNGGPSQMDLFDPKPELQRRHGEDYFDRIAGEVEFPEAAGALMKSPFKFAQHGQCG